MNAGFNNECVSVLTSANLIPLPETMTHKVFLIARQLEKVCPDLAEHIARCTEQAYRRGYQQGALYGKDLDREVCNWRFNGPDHTKYDQAMAPPDIRDLGLYPGLKKAPKGSTYGYTCSAVKRLSLEAGNASDVVAALSRLDN